MAEPAVVQRGVLISAAIPCFCAGGLYGWSALIPFLERQFLATAEQSGLVFSVAVVAFSTAVIAAPRLPLVFNGLRGCAVFACFGAICLMFAMLAPTYLLFLLCFGIGFGLCSGAVYINALATAALSLRPAVMTPVMVASFGLGGAVYGLVWRWMILRGWDAYVLMPLAVSLFLAGVVGFAVNKLSSLSREDSNESSAAESTPASNPLNKPGVLILLWLSFALGSAGGLMVLGLAGKMTDSVGASVAITSMAIAGVAIGNTLGRISVSGFNSVFKPINTALLAVGVVAVGLVATGLAASPLQLALGLILVAVGYGAVASTIPALVAVIYGKKSFSRMFSIIFSAWGVAGLVAPWLAGVVHDRTGEFRLAIVFALLATVGSAVTLILLKVQRSY